MGYCITSKASRTINKIDDFCKNTSEETSSNVFKIEDRKFFYDLRREDQEDGGAILEIHLFIGENLAKHVGDIVINGEGKITKLPSSCKELVNYVETSNRSG